MCRGAGCPRRGRGRAAAGGACSRASGSRRAWASPAVKGGARVDRRSRICAQGGAGGVIEEIACDAVAMSGGWSPVVHLWSHCGGKLRWDDGAGAFRAGPGAAAAGGGRGGLRRAGGLGRRPARARGGPRRRAPRRRPGRRRARASRPEARRRRPPRRRRRRRRRPSGGCRSGAGRGARCEGVRRLPERREGVGSAPRRPRGIHRVEHTKRYTTLGMATDQGKLSNINGLAVLADALGTAIPEVGTTTFRPPYAPVTFGALAGEARGPLFKPTRLTPIDDWHAAHGAHWEPVGDWRRPYCYRRPGESIGQAVSREVLNVRQGVGLLDASTLGKILVKGPDAGRLSRPRLYRGDVEPGGRTLPLRAHVQRERVPVRRRGGGPADRGQLPLPHDDRRLGPGARLDGGMAADRVAGPARSSPRT